MIAGFAGIGNAEPAEGIKRHATLSKFPISVTFPP